MFLVAVCIVETWQFGYISSSYLNKSAALCPLGIFSSGEESIFSAEMNLYSMIFSQSSLNKVPQKAGRYEEGQTVIKYLFIWESVRFKDKKLVDRLVHFYTLDL